MLLLALNGAMEMGQTAWIPETRRAIARARRAIRDLRRRGDAGDAAFSASLAADWGRRLSVGAPDACAAMAQYMG